MTALDLLHSKRLYMRPLTALPFISYINCPIYRWLLVVTHVFFIKLHCHVDIVLYAIDWVPILVSS